MTDKDKSGSAQPCSALVDSNRSGHGFYADLPLDERVRLLAQVDVSAEKIPAVSIDEYAKSIDEHERRDNERQQVELRAVIEESVAQSESEGVLAAAPAWSAWNGLSFVAFRDLALLREIKDEEGLDELVRNGHRSLKAHDPERLLLSALVGDQLRAIRNGEELGRFYWYGKTKVDRDVWFDRDAMLKIFHADPWSLDQMMIWHIARDPQRVENAFKTDRASAALLFKKRPQIQIETAAREITQRCREGLIYTFHVHSKLNPDDWKDLQIEFTDGLLRCVRSSDACPDIAFSPADALRQFPPYKRFNDHQLQDDRGRENPTLAQEIVRDGADSGEQEDGTSTNLSRRLRVSDRPLSKDERQIGKTLAWDVIGKHPKWSKGVSWTWSEAELGKQVTLYAQDLVTKGLLDLGAYNQLRLDRDGKILISGDTADRVLIPKAKRAKSRVT